ncbi:T9SS type A sorting domain-containing protein [Seonamhaeicola maritimus]|uniref:T9SS type A sorting domain-containing protein n=1 Tax=Seonamhaeicola maritimus TaxID=2591822 RepID=A0A5C7GK10_9FLAO|nr:T9SS type A sorting domain-containing protein [Seonamhaeicola maritimus]TXG38602.1 T9SS type A sorting domain-containing protein [Seonamhaeicola maritimus]
MKTKLLFTLLLITFLGYSQTYDNTKYWISEIVASSPNSSSGFINDSDNASLEPYQSDVDDVIEYYEFRGTPNATIENDVYFIAIDGDDEAVGDVQDAIDLSGLQFGANGILVIVADVTMNNGTGAVDLVGLDISGTKWINPWATALASSGANVVTVQLVADTIDWTDENPSDGTNETLNKFNISSRTPDIGYDGSFNDQSSTYMIVKSTAGNPKNELVDTTGPDGVLDGAATAWTIYDAVTILDDDDTTEYAYSGIIFAEDPDGALPVAQTIVYDTSTFPSASIVALNQYPSYVARQGTKTGNSATMDAIHNDDWMAGRLNSLSYPDWGFSSTDDRNFPADPLQSSNLSDHGATIGEVNVDFAALSNEDFIASNFKIYPNPAKDIVTIESNNIEVSSIKIYDILGKQVFAQKGLASKELNISHLNSGIYVLRIDTFEGALNKKIVVE